MKNRNFSTIALWLMPALSWMIALLSYPFLPDAIPLHWNIYGQIDNWGNKFPSAFIFPAIMLGVIILMQVIPKIDPKRMNYERFIGVYQAIQVAVVGLLFSLHLLVCYAALINSEIAVDLIVKLLIGILFVIFGNLMPKIKHNYFVGIRTPWTLASEAVWFRTHRMAGFLWFIGGFVMCMLSFFGGVGSATLYFSVIAVVALAPVIYSYIDFKKHMQS